MLTTPPMFGTSRGPISISQHHGWTQFLSTMVGTQLSSSMVQPQNPNCNCLPPWQRTQLSTYIVQCQLSTAWSGFNFSAPWSDPYFSTPWSELTESFSKSSKFSAHPLRAWRQPHSGPIFCLGFIMKMVIVVSFTQERKLHQLTTHLNS